MTTAFFKRGESIVESYSEEPGWFEIVSKLYNSTGREDASNYVELKTNRVSRPISSSVARTEML